MTLPAEPTRAGVPSARGALAIALLYVLAAVLYAVVSRTIEVPIIFPDEFTYGHISQSIANGDGVSWRGQPESLRSLLYVLAIAPSWIVSSGHGAYQVARSLNAIMAATIVVPTWLLARPMLGPRMALVPAVLSVAGTWMVTTGFLLSESLALPLAVGSLAAMVAALRRPGSRWWIWALALAGLAAYARLQLAVLAFVFLLALLLDAVRGGRGRIRARLFAHRWALGATFVISLIALVVGLSSSSALGIYSDVRHFSPGLGAVLGSSGQHALGLIVAVGFLPAVVVLAMALRAGNWSDEATGPLLAVLIPATVVLVLQSGWFAAGFHLKWDIERYVEYVIPLGLVALVLAPGRIGLRTSAGVAGALALSLLLVNAPENVVEQRAVRGSVHRLGELIPAFGDHPGLGLAVAAAGLSAAGLVLLLRPGRLSPDRSLLAVGGLLLIAFAVQSQASWRNEHGISAYRRAAQPADLDWVDHHAKGTVGIFSPSIDNPNIYATELFNEKIHGRYELQSGLTANGSVCVVALAPTGVLQTPAGCEPPPTLLVDTTFVRATFDGEHRLAENLPNSRLVEVGARPRMLSLVTLSCAERGSAFRGAQGAIRPCTGRLDFKLWPQAPATLVVRFRGGAVQHFGRLAAAERGQTVYDFKPFAPKTIRIPVGPDPTQLTIQLDWPTTENAPTLQSVELQRGSALTGLL